MPTVRHFKRMHVFLFRYLVRLFNLLRLGSLLNVKQSTQSPHLWKMLGFPLRNATTDEEADHLADALADRQNADPTTPPVVKGPAVHRRPAPRTEDRVVPPRPALLCADSAALPSEEMVVGFAGRTSTGRRSRAGVVESGTEEAWNEDIASKSAGDLDRPLAVRKRRRSRRGKRTRRKSLQLRRWGNQ